MTEISRLAKVARFLQDSCAAVDDKLNVRLGRGVGGGEGRVERRERVLVLGGMEGSRGACRLVRVGGLEVFRLR